MTVRTPDHSQTDLFDAAPPAAPAQELRIAPQGAAPLGKDQQTFNRLVREVRKLRDKLAEWEAFEARHHQKVVSELLPLQQELSRARRAMILSVAAILLGKAGGGVSGKAERKNLSAFLLELAEIHLDEDPQDAEIIALHDEYAELSFAEDKELEREMARDMVEEMFGVELGDDELDGSPEDIMAAAMARARQAAEEQAQAEQGRRAGAKGGKAHERGAKKAAAAEQAAQDVSQSVREVFRKLASALHPDRAVDEADRLRRHGLMQRVNHAYDKGDLLSLLTLQLEIEQIDAGHLAQVSKARLGHYNTVLREQVRELQQELEAISGRFTRLFEDPFALVTPAAVEGALKRDLKGARRAIRELAAHHAMLLRPVERRRWLKHYVQERRDDERLEELLLDSFMDTANPFSGEGFDPFSDDGFDPFGPPRRRTPPAGKRRTRRR